jgi:hypothetical protein
MRAMSSMVACEPEMAATRPINSAPDLAGARATCAVEVSMDHPGSNRLCILRNRRVVDLDIIGR